MKLTGERKVKVEEAEAMEEKKTLIAEAGMELTDDEMENVAGGTVRFRTSDQVAFISPIISN